jgi:hypothetical protein
MDNHCPTTPLSCLEPSNIFAGVYKKECSNFANPNNFQAERSIFNSLINEKINNFGIDIDYYVHTYNLSSADNFYGEDLDAPYYGPISLRVEKDYTFSGVPLGIHGFDSNDEITFYVTFDTFEEAFGDHRVHEESGQRIEPKADDMFIIKTWGCDRPNGRTAKKFVVTEAIDEDPEDLNVLMGHYVWKVTARRYDYSYEANIPASDDKYQVYDNTFSGVLTSDISIKGPLEGLVDSEGDLLIGFGGETLVTQTTSQQLSSDDKPYDYDVDVEVEDEIYDQSINDQRIYGNTDQDSSPYGDYY